MSNHLTRLNIQFPGSFHIATMHLSRKTGLILAVLLFGSYVAQNFIDIKVFIFLMLIQLQQDDVCITGTFFFIMVVDYERKAKMDDSGFYRNPYTDGQ